MSRERILRLKRLVAMRAKEVDLRAVALAEARLTETEATKYLEMTRRETARGLAERADRMLRGTEAGDWSQSEVWLTRLTRSEQLAKDTLASATRAVEQARQRVTEARMEQEKFVLLVERVTAEAAEGDKRRLQTTEDEFAVTRLALARSKT
jgi:flagellar export protein FliJ